MKNPRLGRGVPFLWFGMGSFLWRSDGFDALFGIAGEFFASGGSVGRAVRREGRARWYTEGIWHEQGKRGSIQYGALVHGLNRLTGGHEPDRQGTLVHALNHLNYKGASSVRAGRFGQGIPCPGVLRTSHGGSW